MVRYCGTVLVDTNVILEAHRTGTWRALTGGYRVETVEECVTETQTGFQRRRTEWLGARADNIGQPQRVAPTKNRPDCGGVVPDRHGGLFYFEA